MMYILRVLMLMGIADTGSPAGILMYTDLLQATGSTGNCSTVSRKPNATHTKATSADIAVTLSRFTFSKQSSSSESNEEECTQEDITRHDFLSYDWICGTTGSGSETLHYSDWLFFNCTDAIFLSTTCLPKVTMDELKGQLCRNKTAEVTCVSMTSAADGRRHTCSRHFSSEQQVFKESDDESLSFLRPLDIAAYLCASCILVSFLLALCIPASTCKPNYKHDNESGLRVPLEIYEMYGVSYMPSAKRKLTKNTGKWARKLSRQRPHSRNLAVVSSLRDLGRKRASGLLDAARSRSIYIPAITMGVADRENNIDAVSREFVVKKIKHIDNSTKTRNHSIIPILKINDINHNNEDGIFRDELGSNKSDPITRSDVITGPLEYMNTFNGRHDYKNVSFTEEDRELYRDTHLSVASSLPDLSAQAVDTMHKTRTYKKQDYGRRDSVC